MTKYEYKHVTLIVNTLMGTFKLGKNRMSWVYYYAYAYSIDHDAPSASRNQIRKAMLARTRVNHANLVRYARQQNSYKADVFRLGNSIQIGCQYFGGRDYRVLRKWALSNV